MGHYLVRRMLQAILTIWLLTLFIFLLMRILPGNIAFTVYEESATPEIVAAIEEKLGLNKPLYEQYVVWTKDAIWFNLRSFFGDKPVRSFIRDAFPVTLNLTVYAFFITIATALPIGVMSALKHNSWIDYATRVFAIIGLSMPTFWVGVLIIYGLVLFFDWFPGLIWVSPFEDPIANFKQMIWPAMTLAWVNLAAIARMTRSAMLEVLQEDYVRTARAKGLRERTVVMRHAFRNALIPVVALIGVQVARWLGGTMIVEKVFNLRGIGWNLINAVEIRDYAVVEGLIMFAGILVIITTLLVDLTYARLDPRIAYR